MVSTTTDQSPKMSEPTPSKEQIVQEFRIQSIQEATARVVARLGLDGASMQAIAEEAGIAKGTIYLYFKDRLDLLERTASSTLDELLEEMETVFASPGPFPGQLRRLIEGIFHFFEQRRHFFRLYLAVRYPDQDPDEMRQKRPQKPHYQRFLSRLADLLEAAMERGEVRRGEAAPLALFLSEGINAILLARIRGEASASPEAEARWIAQVILDGIARREEA
jgi:AcrR family transcriptional regulator